LARVSLNIRDPSDGIITVAADNQQDEQGRNRDNKKRAFSSHEHKFSGCSEAHYFWYNSPVFFALNIAYHV
jgi:hypothetical protein